MKLYQLALGVLGAILLFHSCAIAQTATGSISGMVQDETGAVVPGAQVTVTNVEKGISSSLATDASGRYHVPNLIPGHYEIQTQVSGFETAVRKGIQVTVGSNLEINMTLKVGQVAQQTVVTAEAPIVETASSALLGLVDEKTVRELPLNGRSFDQLISLESSAPTFRSRSPAGAIHGMSAVYSVNGARTRANMFLIDGTEMVGATQASTLPGGVLGKNMGVDAVQEFTILTSNYSSAYGKKGGGIINIATRSGTNQLHGSVFEFLRNSALDARNFFDQGSSPPPFRRNNFGGALGGPIRKDHSFFFGTYEGLREGLGLTSLAIVPDADAHRGFLPQAGNPGQLLNVGVAPSVRPYLDTLFPLPNGRNFGNGTGELQGHPNQISSQDFFLVRFDQRLSDKYSLFGRFNFTEGSRTNPDINPIFIESETNRDHITTLELKRAAATTVNVLRFGYTRSRTYLTSFSTVPLDPSLNFYPWADLVGQIAFSASVTSVALLSPAGSSSNVDRSFVLNQFDLADQVYHYRGAHSLQFGVQMQRIQNNQRYTPGSTRGNFEFADLASFLAGKATLFQGTTGENDPTKAYRQIYFSTFIQDDYKLRRNLTLNLGLRYELFTVPVEASGNRISNYHRHLVNGYLVVDSLPTLGSPMFQGNHNGFAPRVGFAWDPWNDGKLVVRGGFGMFYDQIDSEYFILTPPNPPFVTQLTVNNPPFPRGFSGAAGTTPIPGPDVIDFGLNVPTRLQYSFGVQRQITASNAVSVSYVGSNSYHLTRQWDTNTARPQILAGGVLFYPAGAPRLNPEVGRTRSLISDAVARYNSLQMDFMQRASRNIRFKVSYTFAHSLDDASTTAGSQASGTSQATQNPFDRRADYGLSVFDLRHNLVTNFTYDVPAGNLTGRAKNIVGGWQLGGIVSVSSGTPFTALVGFNRSRDLSRYVPDRPNLKAGASNNPVKGGPDLYFDPSAFELQPAGFYGNLGRDTLIGPGFVNVDMTISKSTSLNERLKADFRAEFFNLMNRANFDLPNHSTFNSNGSPFGAAGRIQNTVSTSRQIQFGLKLTF